MHNPCIRRIANALPVLPSMELRQLRHFVAVVDSANLSRAAERVAISQPALTRSIKNLEELLGVELLGGRVTSY